MAGFFRWQMKLFKQQPDLVPLTGAVGFACALALVFGVRTAMRNPDVSWKHEANPEPWNKLKQDQQFKLLNITGFNYSKRKFPEERPSMQNEMYKDI